MCCTVVSFVLCPVCIAWYNIVSHVSYRMVCYLLYVLYCLNNPVFCIVFCILCCVLHLYCCFVFCIALYVLFFVLYFLYCISCTV